MRKSVIYIVLFLGGVISSAHAQEVSSTAAASAISEIDWAETSIDVGRVEQNTPVEVSYKFTNTGQAPLMIKNVRTSCGCTAGKYEKEPILPGESSEIVVSYNAKAPGKFSKTITVYTNTANTVNQLYIKGEVVQP